MNNLRSLVLPVCTWMLLSSCSSSKPTDSPVTPASTEHQLAQAGSATSLANAPGGTVTFKLGDLRKVVKVEGARAKVTLLNGTEKSEVELIPAGDKLEAKGAFKITKGTKGIVLVTLAGKAATTARFEIK